MAEETWLDETEQRAWRGLVRTVQLLPLALDRQLQAEAGIPHAYYLVLAMLSEAPGTEHRMRDLAQATGQSQSRLSHSVARLEERGWVERRRSSTDGRGQVAGLTETGLAALVAAAPGHAAEVRRRVLAPLTREQVLALVGIAEALAAGLEDELLAPNRTPG